MKKIVLSLALAVSALAANAQVYVGGDFSLWRNTEKSANETNFTIAPEIGYTLDENSEIGIALGYMHEYEGSASHNGTSTSLNAFAIAPYYRYNFLKTKNIDLFIEAGFGIATGKEKVEYAAGNATTSVESDAANSYEIGLKPGVAVNLNSKLSFVAKAGFFGYRTTNDNATTNAFGDNGFGVAASTNDLSFGFVYKF